MATIFVVEDNETLREAVVSYLELSDHEVLEFGKTAGVMGQALDYLTAEGSERTIDTHIKNLRAKLAHSGWIETVRGFGYRFTGEPR